MAKKKIVSVAYLDQIFSIYIRLRDANTDGYISCCECGKTFWWQESTNGHFVKRRHHTLRWDERNCHAQCAPCNGQDTNLRYADFMVIKYGPEIWGILDAQKNNRGKILPYERKIMADNYRAKIKQLKKEKGL
jgi:hypothetical protein